MQLIGLLFFQLLPSILPNVGIELFATHIELHQKFRIQVTYARGAPEVRRSFQTPDAEARRDSESGVGRVLAISYEPRRGGVFIGEIG